MKKPEVGEIYRHFKGIYIYIKEIVLDSETVEEMVVYTHIGSKKTWVRSLKSFSDDVDVKRKDNITGQDKRFKLIQMEEIK